MSKITVFLDARCLQDPRFRNRGVGSHVGSLLRAARLAADAELLLVGLVDAGLPKLSDSIAGCFDTVAPHANPVIPRGGAIFIGSSPMTHDPTRFMRLIGHQSVLTAALVYDFIPYDLPGYLKQKSAALEYDSCVEWLKLYDLFFPISQFSADRLHHYTRAASENIHVTGCAARDTLARVIGAPGTPQKMAAPKDARYFLLASGDDRRKNSEIAFEALDLLGQQGRADVSIKVLGFHSEVAAKSLLLSVPAYLHRRIEFLSVILDVDLAAVYAGATATIVPSRMEGFSIPVVESIICGAPVIASACEAHRELIPDDAVLFEPSDAADLASHLANAIDDASWRARALERQRSVAENASPERVGRRFWAPLLRAFRDRFPAQWSTTVRLRRPRLALVTPYPPDQSGIARYSRHTVDALVARCDVSVFSDAPKNNPRMIVDRMIAGPIDVLPLLRTSFDAVVFVSGNSHFHDSILDLCETYGGPIIQHDSRLTQIYHHRWGPGKFRQRAMEIIGRIPGDEEVAQWLHDENPPSLFLEPIIAKADPLIVHTEPFRALLQVRYGVDAKISPFATVSQFSASDLSPERRIAARARLEVAPETLVISTFGYAMPSKGSLECVAALRMLRNWKVPAELHFVGSNEHLHEQLDADVKDLGLSAFVRMYPGFVSDELYGAYMLGSDVGIQLRTYGFGQPSGTLTECIAAGMACVASEEVAAACEAPSFVKRIPNKPSPLFIAEAVMALYESGDTKIRLRGERDNYIEQHSFSNYASRFLEILGLS